MHGRRSADTGKKKQGNVREETQNRRHTVLRLLCIISNKRSCGKRTEHSVGREGAAKQNEGEEARDYCLRSQLDPNLASEVFKSNLFLTLN